MILNEYNKFSMDRPMVNISPGLSNANNIININNNNMCLTVDLLYNTNNIGNNLNNYNNNNNNFALVYNQLVDGVNGANNNMADGCIFDDKLFDCDQDLDTLGLSLWQSEGFNGANCDEPMKIEDFFQTDIGSFSGHGPTLAELNLVDDKLDSTDLDEYLSNPPSMSTVIDNINIDGDKSPSTTPIDNNKKLNTLSGLVFNANCIPTTSASVQLTPDEVDQIISLTEPVNSQEYDPVCSNNQPSPSSYSSPCRFWQTKKAHNSPEFNVQPHSSNQLPSSSQVDIKPYVDHKLFAPTTSSSNNLICGSIINSNSNSNLETISESPFMTIKQEPVSPSMDLSNLVISHDKENCDAGMENGKLVNQTTHRSESSPEYVKSRLRRRNNSNSTECSFSSHDEGFASQPEDNSDNDQENEDSDDESFYNDYNAKDLLGATTSDDAENKWALDMGRSRKTGQQRYFWQYNVQSKGPKGSRIISVQEKCNDPHVLAEAKDPVFSSECSMKGVKHAGKARRGDGNDLTPNPKKLLMIGLELKKLSKVINDLTPVAQVPVNSRNKSRKEKNKLASRACRLKKKAQHEANKIKLFGLQQEHKKMMNALIDIQHLANVVLDEKKSIREERLFESYENIVSTKGPKVKVAGNTTEFVNSILDNVSAGISDGGLDKL